MMEALTTENFLELSRGGVQKEGTHHLLLLALRGGLLEGWVVGGVGGWIVGGWMVEGG